MIKKPHHSDPQVSLVVTYLNEAEHLTEFLNSIAEQTYRDFELIMIDGGATDDSWRLIRNLAGKLKLKLILKRRVGNISLGRNYGVSLAKNNLIAFTDVGCLPQPDWLAQLVRSYLQSHRPVVAGYYYGLPQTKLEQAMIVYSLVQPDKLDPATFLPASRSMLIEKSMFNQVGGFNEKLVVSEDYDLSQKILKLSRHQNKSLIVFNAKARVGWYPRKNLRQFAGMIYNQTRYDLLAGHVRPKVVLVGLRYLLALNLLCGAIAFASQTIALILVTGFLLYILWSIVKNINSARNSWYFLPILQIISDMSVIAGLISAIIIGR